MNEERAESREQGRVLEFQPCADCVLGEIEPDTLCEACFHNREVIRILKDRLEQQDKAKARSTSKGILANILTEVYSWHEGKQKECIAQRRLDRAKTHAESAAHFKALADGEGK